MAERRFAGADLDDGEQHDGHQHAHREAEEQLPQPARCRGGRYRGGRAGGHARRSRGRRVVRARLHFLEVVGRHVVRGHAHRPRDRRVGHALGPRPARRQHARPRGLDQPADRRPVARRVAVQTEHQPAARADGGLRFGRPGRHAAPLALAPARLREVGVERHLPPLLRRDQRQRFREETEYVLVGPEHEVRGFAGGRAGEYASPPRVAGRLFPAHTLSRVGGPARCGAPGRQGADGAVPRGLERPRLARRRRPAARQVVGGERDVVRQVVVPPGVVQPGVRDPRQHVVRPPAGGGDGVGVDDRVAVRLRVGADPQVAVRRQPLQPLDERLRDAVGLRDHAVPDRAGAQPARGRRVDQFVGHGRFPVGAGGRRPPEISCGKCLCSPSRSGNSTPAGRTFAGRTVHRFVAAFSVGAVPSALTPT